MGLTHASLTPGESLHATRPEGHSVKRSYVPIKPAFRPLLPKPVTRDASPSTGIQIHTRATLNAGRKRLVTSKPVDLQKRRRPSPSHSPATSPVSTASPKMASPVAMAKPKVDIATPSPINASIAPKSPPITTSIVSDSAKTSSLPIDIAKPQSNWTNDAFVSPPTPASLGESPQGINMASLVGSNTNNTIDPVYIMDNEFDQFSGLSLAPTSSMSSVDEHWNMADLAPINDDTTLQLSPDFTGGFDDLSEFYFREPSEVMHSTETVSDVVSNFMETQLDASLPMDENVNSEMAIMDYFVPANELF